MRIMILVAIFMFLGTVAHAEFITHSGILRSMKNSRIVLIERGNEKTLEYGKDAACYLGGREVSCERIRPNSQVRVDCPTGRACPRIIVDQGPR